MNLKYILKDDLYEINDIHGLKIYKKRNKELGYILGITNNIRTISCQCYCTLNEAIEAAIIINNKKI